MSMPVFERTAAPPTTCAACGNMEVTIDLPTRLCVGCWRVVKLLPWAMQEAADRKADLEIGEPYPGRHSFAHG